jgi:DNA polymerase-3 subunit gamma/tau
MTLLRMLAFRPLDDPGGGREAPVRQGRATPRQAKPVARDGERKGPRASVAEAPQTAPAEAPTATRDPTDWHRTVPGLGLGGMALQLANHCSVRRWDGQVLTLQVEPGCQGLIGSKAEAGLAEALGRWLGKPLVLRLETVAGHDAVARETPAQRTARAAAQRQDEAVAAMRSDPVVKAVEEVFDAELIEETIRPV